MDDSMKVLNPINKIRKKNLEKMIRKMGYVSPVSDDLTSFIKKGIDKKLYDKLTTNFLTTIQ